jgi:hypothetical protein
MHRRDIPESRKRVWRADLVIALALGLSLGGCSFFMKKDSGWKSAERAPRCSESRIAPIADTAIASILGSVAIYFAVLSMDTEESECAGSAPVCDQSLRPLAILGAATAGFYILGAYTGFRNRGACCGAKQEYELLRRRDDGEAPEVKPEKGHEEDAEEAQSSPIQ